MASSPAEPVLLGSDEGVLAIRPLGWEWSSDELALPTNTLVEVAPEGAELWIVTGSQWGPFEVNMLWHGPRVDAPAPPTWAQEEVEFDLPGSGSLTVTDLLDTTDGPVIELDGELIRIRVCAFGRLAGRTTNPDPQDEPIERYAIEAWAATAPTPPRVAVLTAEELDGPAVTPAPADEEVVAAGKAGRARIGRDIDATTGPRTPPGGLAWLEVERTIAADAEEVFDDLVGVAAWSYDVAIFMFPSSGRWYYESVEDGLTGESGQIRQNEVHRERPHRVERIWHWGQVWAGAERRLLWETPTQLIFTFEPVSDGSGTATRVVVRLVDVPADWVDDLRAYWTWQLELLSNRFQQEGTA